MYNKLQKEIENKLGEDKAADWFRENLNFTSYGYDSYKMSKQDWAEDFKAMNDLLGKKEEEQSSQIGKYINPKGEMIEIIEVNGIIGKTVDGKNLMMSVLKAVN